MTRSKASSTTTSAPSFLRLAADLEPNVAAADDDRPRPRPDRRPDALGIGERAQIEDALQLLAREPEAPRPGPVQSTRAS